MSFLKLGSIRKPPILLKTYDKIVLNNQDSINGTGEYATGISGEASRAYS